ncbi:hypothetical protein VP01_6236g1, partial [Puccinia sorghi]
CIEFVVELVWTEPEFFLIKMHNCFYSLCETLLSIQAIHQNLVNRLCLTLKKAKTPNVHKSLVAKYTFIYGKKKTKLTSAFYFKKLRVWNPAARHITNQEHDCISLLPAIFIGGVIALTTTMDTFNRPNLIKQMNSYPAKNLVLVLDNAAIHSGKYLNIIYLRLSSIKIKLKSTPELTHNLNPRWAIWQVSVKTMTVNLLL